MAKQKKKNYRGIRKRRKIHFFPYIYDVGKPVQDSYTYVRGFFVNFENYKRDIFPDCRRLIFFFSFLEKNVCLQLLFLYEYSKLNVFLFGMDI